jgi:hypothetical protein
MGRWRIAHSEDDIVGDEAAAVMELDAERSGAAEALDGADVTLDAV